MFERLDEGGVAMLIILGSAFGGPSVPNRPTAEGGSGTSAFGIRCLPRKSARLGSLGGGGCGNDGDTCDAFGIGGGDGGGLEEPSELADGDTMTEPDLGVGGTLLEDELDDELGSAEGKEYTDEAGEPN